MRILGDRKPPATLRPPGHHHYFTWVNRPSGRIQLCYACGQTRN